MKTALIILKLIAETENGYGYDYKTNLFTCDGVSVVCPELVYKAIHDLVKLV